MTLEDIEQYFGTSYQFSKKTGMPANNYYNWRKAGFIPIRTQIKLQKITEGRLQASLEDLAKEKLLEIVYDEV